ncbi:NDP-hexose 2,3-dehydratase family protein [Streptomyces sp. NBC_00328]|uniref:NDP-hexose 2,3-dehydratase family protein n=1 Tax=Streptomyces sp. NBC_00328 TaxID=2903646 RepID=UPI002E2A52E4|nr:NDP-hexose 2,3-dehydratase family protein [Streptomyces sp. NBC_00328]
MLQLAQRVARSAATLATPTSTLDGFRAWWQRQQAADTTRVERIPFDELRSWAFERQTGNLVHDSGSFYTIEGLRVHRDSGPVPAWTQPIIHQPEIGILGLVAKEFDGVLHFLMQAKMEPGNFGGLQLSPTVQATRSNYRRVHSGRAVSYVDYFTGPRRPRVLADARQSEQGSWFYRKRNRNVVVEATGDVDVLDGFRWLTLGQLHHLLEFDDLVNMDSRSVLACLPFAFGGTADGPGEVSTELLSWITDARTRHDVTAERIALSQVTGWKTLPDRVTHDGGAFFDIIAVDVTTEGREVRSWTQPLLSPRGVGVAGFLVRRTEDGPDVLVGTRVEAGSADVLELGPTVQCTPENYAALPAAPEIPFLDCLVQAPKDRILFDTVLSEEGGRFHHARNRYMLVEAPPDTERHASPDHRWVAVSELAGLIRHSHYLNVEARTLITCLQKVLTCSPTPPQYDL